MSKRHQKKNFMQSRLVSAIHDCIICHEERELSGFLWTQSAKKEHMPAFCQTVKSHPPVALGSLPLNAFSTQRNHHKHPARCSNTSMCSHQYGSSKHQKMGQGWCLYCKCISAGDTHLAIFCASTATDILHLISNEQQPHAAS